MNLTSTGGRSSLLVMKGFAHGIIHTLAFVAILAMQPIGQQYCTANDLLCCNSTFTHSDLHTADCCCNDGEQNNESPCCVEVFSKLPFVPGHAAMVAPDPLAFDLLALEPVYRFDRFQLEESGNSKTTDIDPPPRSTSRLTLHCVRLV